jgi:hypothetical protein
MQQDAVYEFLLVGLSVCVIKGLAVKGNVGVVLFHAFLTSPSCLNRFMSDTQSVGGWVCPTTLYALEKEKSLAITRHNAHSPCSQGSVWMMLIFVCFVLHTTCMTFWSMDTGKKLI